MTDDKVTEIVSNLDAGIKDGMQNALAIRILELEEEIEAMTLESKQLRKQFLDKMLGAGIKSINTKFGSFQAIEKKNIKVDKKQAQIALDSMGILEQYLKLDETLVKNAFYKPDSNTSYDFIEEKEPTVYLAIKKGK